MTGNNPNHRKFIAQAEWKALLFSSQVFLSRFCSFLSSSAPTHLLSSSLFLKGRVLSLSGNSGFEIGDTRLLYRVLFTEKKSGEGLAFGCKTTVFESGIAEGGHQNSFQWKDEEFSFEIMASDQSLEEEGSVFFPVQGEIIITFYRSVEQGGNALIGSVSIDLQKFENKGLKKEEYFMVTTIAKI